MFYSIKSAFLYATLCNFDIFCRNKGKYLFMSVKNINFAPDFKLYVINMCIKS